MQNDPNHFSNMNKFHSQLSLDVTEKIGRLTNDNYIYLLFRADAYWGLVSIELNPGPAAPAIYMLMRAVNTLDPASDLTVRVWLQNAGIKLEEEDFGCVIQPIGFFIGNQQLGAANFQIKAFIRSLLICSIADFLEDLTIDGDVESNPGPPKISDPHKGTEKEKMKSPQSPSPPPAKYSGTTSASQVQNQNNHGPSGKFNSGSASTTQAQNQNNHTPGGKFNGHHGSGNKWRGGGGKQGALINSLSGALCELLGSKDAKAQKKQEDKEDKKDDPPPTHDESGALLGEKLTFPIQVPPALYVCPVQLSIAEDCLSYMRWTARFETLKDNLLRLCASITTPPEEVSDACAFAGIFVDAAVDDCKQLWSVQQEDDAYYVREGMQNAGLQPAQYPVLRAYLDTKLAVTRPFRFAPTFYNSVLLPRRKSAKRVLRNFGRAMSLWSCPEWCDVLPDFDHLVTEVINPNSITKAELWFDIQGFDVLDHDGRPLDARAYKVKQKDVILRGRYYLSVDRRFYDWGKKQFVVEQGTRIECAGPAVPERMKQFCPVENRSYFKSATINFCFLQNFNRPTLMVNDKQASDLRRLLVTTTNGQQSLEAGLFNHLNEARCDLKATIELMGMVVEETLNTTVFDKGPILK